MSSTVSQEEEVVQSASWPSEEHPISSSQLNKGKERQIHTENQDSSFLRTGSSEALDAISYPPINDDAEETRRVEETLRRWEIAERQRRKAARESSQKSALPSYVSGTSRRPSLLWQVRKSKVPSTSGLGAHAALQSQDNTDTLPLRDINISPTPSTSRSDSEDGYIVDPFVNPPDSLSPFSDAHQLGQPGAIPVPYKNEMPTPVSITDPPKAGHPPPPKPLSLPPPRTPPPIASLSPISQSNPIFGASNEQHMLQDTRWWHDWLCGCGEGPDRGGDNQAGRTNPFE
ncbi:hypothetical protein BYT27DRAFT_7130340 [Phlegmacium glaucopus]|nr:hypothetical protein BYT27DRAFT_7130340 [Phlegmacium glaucopus]